jgi:hypothetical protein
VKHRGQTAFGPLHLHADCVVGKDAMHVSAAAPNRALEPEASVAKLIKAKRKGKSKRQIEKANRKGKTKRQNEKIRGDPAHWRRDSIQSAW